jgi:hypothetical protein
MAANREQVLAAMQGHVLAAGNLIGTHKRGEAVAKR